MKCSEDEEIKQTLREDRVKPFKFHALLSVSFEWFCTHFFFWNHVIERINFRAYIMVFALGFRDFFKLNKNITYSMLASSKQHFTGLLVYIHIVRTHIWAYISYRVTYTLEFCFNLEEDWLFLPLNMILILCFSFTYFLF